MNKLLSGAAVLALPLFGGCEERECSENADCGIGNVCSVEGTCNLGGGGIAAAAGAGSRTWSDPAVVDVAVPSLGSAEFDGNIGVTNSSGAADLNVSSTPNGVVIRVALPERPNTFLAVTLADPSRLAVAGQIQIADPADGALGASWAQACNYDEQDGYDEPINDAVIDVPAADEDGVVGLIISVNGEWTDGTARVPWLLLAQQ